MRAALQLMSIWYSSCVNPCMARILPQLILSAKTRPWPPSRLKNTPSALWAGHGSYMFLPLIFSAVPDF